MTLEYSKLKGRIKEKAGTQEELAKKMNVSSASISYKLSGRTQFSQKDIKRLCEILDIPADKIGVYFFAD